ncbi:energy-coupling factor transporter transmembrane component T family protein [Protaetiibacter larvae]|uniref:Energy-coupling factor transporter transmembrane protein EcfT n=1 Tax=Protaetiibacter larvae TaxID=2592654 RepID=A0A5C1Y773_9MICO|nr:energy-coupling factor transporter transmembrane component T [Protaetiibacter larvae]QEO09661.1 energy-coupling factor transporter transmembrane protein EcfT [Protaetiibacter larvae]
MRINPVARLAAGIVVALGIVWSIDPVSAGVALVLELALFPLLRIPLRVFWTRTALIWIAAPLTGLTVLLYGRVSGVSYLDWAFVHITDGSIQLAVAGTIRVLALALPTVVLLIGVDPTELADGLAQRVKLPARFVIGALAAARLVGLLREDARMLELARRARGVGDRGRFRRFAGLAFAVLVLAVRRGSALATAMEARGFGGPGPRSWARDSAFGAREWALLAIAVVVAGVAVLAAVLTGWWTPVVG